MANQTIPDSGLWSSIAAILNSNFDETGAIAVDLLISSMSTASSQEPTALDSPIQVEYGAAQSVAAVELDVDGTVLFKESGTYYINIRGQYGAPAGAGEAALRFRAEINGIPYGDVLSASVKDTKTSVPLVVPFFFPATAGDELKTFLLRDSSKDNKGGLFQETTALPNWDDSPSASIVIERLINTTDV